MGQIIKPLIKNSESQIITNWYKLLQTQTKRYKHKRTVTITNERLQTQTNRYKHKQNAQTHTKCTNTNTQTIQKDTQVTVTNRYIISKNRRTCTRCDIYTRITKRLRATHSNKFVYINVNKNISPLRRMSNIVRGSGNQSYIIHKNFLSVYMVGTTVVPPNT